MSLLLIDKSACVRGRVETNDVDELCLCAVTRLELLYSARSYRDYQRLEDDLELFRDLRMDAQTFAIALSAQRELAAAGPASRRHPGPARRGLRPAARRRDQPCRPPLRDARGGSRVYTPASPLIDARRSSNGSMRRRTHELHAYNQA